MFLYLSSFRLRMMSPSRGSPLFRASSLGVNLRVDRRGGDWAFFAIATAGGGGFDVEEIVRTPLRGRVFASGCDRLVSLITCRSELNLLLLGDLGGDGLVLLGLGASISGIVDCPHLL